MLNERQKSILKSVARKPNDPLFGQINEALELAITQVKLENSKAFLEEHEFKNRNFYHKPRHKEIVYKSYIEE